jgi:hypothetical protein
MSPRSGTSNSGLIIAGSSLLIAAVCYYADKCNMPIVANWLDWISDRIYQSFPILARLAPNAAMFVSAAAVGLVVLVVSALLLGGLTQSCTMNDRLERQLKKRSETKVKRISGVRVK